MPAIQTPRTHGYATDVIAGKPAPTKPAQPVGAGLARDTDAANSRIPHRRYRRQACSNKARASLWERVLPAMQTPRTHGYPTDAIAGKPAPTEPAQPVGAGLARDANAANSRTPRRRHRRQASSNGARATCRSGSCPRFRRRAPTGTAPRPSQASQLQHGPRNL